MSVSLEKENEGRGQRNIDVHTLKKQLRFVAEISGHPKRLADELTERLINRAEAS